MKGIVLSDTDAAYIAGLLDGEGSFHIGKHYNKTKHCSRRGFNWEIRIRVGMADTQALEFLREKYKKTSELRPRKVQAGHRPMYSVSLYGGEIRETIDQLLPFLKVKLQQGQLIKEAVNLIGPKMDPTVDSRLEAIREEISSLNNPSRTLMGGAVVRAKKEGDSN